MPMPVLQGIILTPDGVDHEAAIAAVYTLNLVAHAFNADKRFAQVRIRYWHTLDDYNADNIHIKDEVLVFKNGGGDGEHPFDSIFQTPDNPNTHLFNYIAALPQFSGWVTVPIDEEG